MGLKDIHLKHCYDSDEDDVLNDFYIPALKNACKYYRLAGFFNSKSLAIAARGIQGLVKNNGEMKLVTGAILSKEDVEAIREGIEDPEKAIEKMMIKDLDEIEDKFVKDHVRALGWLVANKKLEIKIAIPVDESNLPLDIESVERSGIFHQKIGILEDEEGNVVSFSGSENETAASWQNNIEEFKVFRSWIEAERQYLEADLKRFYKFWNGTATRTKIFDIPEAIREKLIKLAPRDFDELNLDKWRTKWKKSIKLRDYQEEAIEKWIENGKKGIFEMATGTGKTFTALGCLDKILKEEKKLVTVIACPYNHLIHQWDEEIDKFNLRIDRIIADSSNPKWKRQLTDYLLDIKIGLKNKLIVLTTHDTFSKEDFLKIIKMSTAKLFLIVDEVHGIGAPIRKNGLIENYTYRLGLSATPKRWLDPEGTKYIFDFFGKVVYEFSLKQAISTINPDTGETYLTPYEYKPVFVELTDDELEEYEKITYKIAKVYEETDEEEREKIFEILCIKRQRIIENASRKLIALEKILDEIGELRHCLIYVSPKQLEKVQDILNKRGIIQHKFTMKEGTKPDKNYGGLSERDFLLKKFAEGRYQALVAIKCLDEGVDVPPAKIAIILASSGNPRQFIQRRGRILRHYPDKNKAIIYDVIVKPPSLHRTNQSVWQLERRIVEKELKRYKEFAYLALNKVECLEKIEDLEEKYKICVRVEW